MEDRSETSSGRSIDALNTAFHPAKNGDYAFLLHFIANHLRGQVKARLFCPTVSCSEATEEADIRKNLIERGLIKGIIGLPANSVLWDRYSPLVYLVIDKEEALMNRDDIFMIDASKGFLKDGNKKPFAGRQDIHKIVSVFNERREVEGYSRIVPKDSNRRI